LSGAGTGFDGTGVVADGGLGFGPSLHAVASVQTTEIIPTRPLVSMVVMFIVEFLTFRRIPF